MRLRLVLSSPRGAQGDPLRSHLQSWLDRLPGKLPSHDRKQLLDDLCFLLRSPLYLYAIAPRLRHAISPLDSDAIGFRTPGSPPNGLERVRDLNIHALNMMIVRESNGWATQLLYGGTLLIEGRQYITTEKACFTQSFHWFCDEARFLSCEFHTRENAAIEARGAALAAEPAEMQVRQTRARTAGQKQRRIIKLKVRYQMARGRPVLAKDAR